MCRAVVVVGGALSDECRSSIKSLYYLPLAAGIDSALAKTNVYLRPSVRNRDPLERPLKT